MDPMRDVKHLHTKKYLTVLVDVFFGLRAEYHTDSWVVAHAVRVTWEAAIWLKGLDGFYRTFVSVRSV